MKMNNYLLITGMFRSGTTLVSKILNAHHDVVAVPDVFTPFFNVFRDDIATQLGIPTTPLEYLHDYFADEPQFQILSENLRTSFHSKYPPEMKLPLLQAIQSRGRLTCPSIVKNLNNITGDTYKEVYETLIALISSSYGDGQEKIVGNKEVWITEFIPALARTFPKAKFIIVNRDPRAVCASKNVASTRSTSTISQEKYPWLFLIKQWRKLTILAWLFKTAPELKDRICYLQYENLLLNPQQTIGKMCQFLKIDLDPKMLDPNSFTDGKGQKWLQNSSYNAIDKVDGFLVFKEKSTGFDASKINKWQEVLSIKEVEYIEQLCHTEMKLCGYSFSGSGKLGLSQDLIFNPPQIAPEELQEWIQQIYVNHGSATLLNEMALEDLRQQLLLMSDQDSSKLTRNIINSYFINHQYFKKARELLV